ncbi:MAG: Txe/YoeB family addiction module toxin [Oscillospiraceae bacterium]|jgi:toxin YoeB|nr:Txe/YoeB family addiction module toxin [Oscillospiraceae bacterium]
MNKIWQDNAWAEYLYWQTQDRKTIKKINALVLDIERNGYNGIGKPEPLKGDLTGWWSVRINDVDRLVFRISGTAPEQALIILACKGHYGD